MKLSLIIPIYNEEKYITRVISRVVNADSSNFRKEIIIVNDGSTDNTREELKKIKNKYEKNTNIDLVIISRKINKGKGYSVREGILNSSGDIVLIQDADLEYSPKDYPKILEIFKENNADVVYGSRFVTTEARRVIYYWHYVVNKGLTVLSNMLTNLNLTDMETGYKAFKRDLIREIAKNLESDRFGFEPEVTAKIAKIKGIKIYEVGISYTGRTYAEGKKIGWRDGIVALWKIIKYNVLE